MENCDWMYTGHASMTPEWMTKTNAFLEHSFGKAARESSRMPCPYSKCDNRVRKNRKNVGEDLCKYGFMPNYTCWIHHGEADRIREEVVRPRLEAFDGDARVTDWMDDFQEAWVVEGLEDELEESTKVYYDMLSSAQKPLHEKTMVSQLDAIGRLMAFKSQCSMSQDNFDGMLAVVGSLLLEGHILPKNLYESQKLLRALKMSYEHIHACPNGCVLFRKDHEKATHCPKCKSSRYLEVDTSDGKKEQLGIPTKVLRYLPIIPRIQRLYMTKESTKQMTWHKHGKRYNANKMVHPSDGDAWTHYDGIHHGKAEEA
jgi:hypothetical protein